MLDEKITRVRELAAKRDEIDAELALLLGVLPRKPRARARTTEQEDGHTAGTETV
jgi:hypothetical protein